jgi:predicted DNA-binding protein
MLCGARAVHGAASMAKANARVSKKAKKPRITITTSPEVIGRLKDLAAANQRSLAWVINYAIEEILEKLEGDPTLQLPVRSSPQPGQGDEERENHAKLT